ncbi:unnamed protein product, partial [Iphiclides podalirius]
MWFIVFALAVAVLVAGDPPGPWWGSAVYYRILVDSFKDGDGDGLGDLLGAAKQMSYVRALGADAVILTPLSSKSTDCSQPGTIDLKQIDPRYGDVDKFVSLLKKASKLELKVVITLQLETISVASEWFKLSAGRARGYEDMVLWKEDETRARLATPPHGAKNNEAVLNLCSENTAAALVEALCVWLKRGVAGAVLKVDHPPDLGCSAALVKSLAMDAVRCARSANLEVPVTVVETALDAAAAELYAEAGANSVISKALTALDRPSAAGLALAMHATVLFSPQDGPAWTTSETDENRIATRYGSDIVDAINMLALTLPGAAIIQQGDELGAADTLLEWSTTTDCWPVKMTPAAAPFPWDDGPSAGFSTGQPWLPIAPNYRYANAKTEFANDFSHVGVLRVAAAMRRSPAMGPHAEIQRLGDAIAILRWGGAGSLLNVANLGRGAVDVQLSKIPGLPSVMSVAASSSGSSVSSGSHVTIDRGIRLNAGESVLMAGPPRHCGGPGPVDKIANKLSEGWQRINKYFSGA